MSPLAIRLLSALFGVLILFFVYYFGGREGIFYLSLVCVFRAAYEYGRMIFNSPASLWLFSALCTLAPVSDRYRPNFFLGYFGFWISLVMASFIVHMMFSTKISKDINEVSQKLSSTVLGYIYCGLFPVFVLRILYWGDSIFWFLFFLAVVFGSDTFAYFGGRFFGRQKLLESVSPKKTREGAVGGLLGSLFIGLVVCMYYEKPVPLVLVGVFGAALLSQIGDLFESLIKRVHNVKDSGRLMPGHGGLLDRLDGVYFAAPFFYYFLVKCL